MNDYEIMTLVTLAVAFTLNGVPTSPSDVTLYVLPPGGPEKQFTLSGAQVRANGTGNFEYDLLVDKSGLWGYKWQGTGAVQVTTPDQQLTVNKSALIAG